MASWDRCSVARNKNTRLETVTQDAGGLLNVSQEAIDRLSVLYVRALGRLAVAAEEVERALGLPPIVLPPSEPSEPTETWSRTSSAMR